MKTKKVNKTAKWVHHVIPVPPCKPGRLCPRCAKAMNMYNTNRLCYNCTREVLLAGKDPVHWRPSKNKGGK